MIRGCSGLFAAFFFLWFDVFHLYGAAAPAGLLAELRKLSPAERESHLVEGAKREGKMIWYSNINLDQAGKMKGEFERRYPFVKVDLWRGSGNQVVDRVLNEARAGKNDVDVINAGGVGTYILVREGMIGRYVSPESAGYANIFRDKEGYWTSMAYSPSIMAYNTNLVKAEEAPKRYEDFLQLKWKGEIAIDMESDRIVSAWLASWGEKKTVDYMNGLVANNIIIRKGHTLLTQLLCSGEFKVAPELYAYQVARMKHERGCPIGFNFPNPAPSSMTPLAMAKRTSHAHAAALFIDFLLSAGGQKIVSDVGRLPSRRGVAAKYGELTDLESKGIKFLMLGPEEEGKYLSRSFNLVEEIFVRRRRQL